MNQVKKALQFVDLHILILISIFLFLFSNIISKVLEKSSHFSSYEACIIGGIALFLIPQGIIFTREVSIKSWKLQIKNRRYFVSNQILVLYFVATFWAYLLIDRWLIWVMCSGLWLVLYLSGRFS
jgi:hypothetical protein